MVREELKYRIGITLLDGVGDVIAKRLIAYCGGAEAVFKEKKKGLLKVPGVGEWLAKSILEQAVLSRAEEETGFIEKYKIEPLFYLDENYPSRLKNCDDAPVMLYYKGNANLNEKKIISIVGTRNATNYGKHVCEKMMEGLAEQHVLIVSGLAYGIDSCAHKAALKNKLNTVGVLAHGLDMIYPSSNTKMAKEMTAQGGLLTEFLSYTKMTPDFFPRRNRIVAGIADATVVIESSEKGGSLITAEIANAYNRDVFAFPGRVSDEHSSGCHWLIKTNRAMLVENAKDLLLALGWETIGKKKKPVQKELFIELNEDEKTILKILNKKEQINIDTLSAETNFPMSKTSSLLLNLEFNGLVKTLPGKVYTLA